MNTVPAMKLVAIVSRLAALGVATFILGLAFDTQALAFFAVAVAALVLLIAVGDYAPHATLAVAKPHRGTMLPFAPANSRVAAMEDLAA